MNVAAIPAVFKDSDRWAIGRSKTPYIADDSGKASSTDPSTWRPFADALAAVTLGKGDALWYALDPESGIVAVDLDKCRDPESGVLLPFARAFVALLDSYTEVSPSGTGVHVYLRATKPSDECKRGLVECYDRARFMSMTGDRLEGTPSTIEPRQAEIEAFFTLAFPPKQAAPAARETSTPAPVTLDDAELLKRMFGASNGAAIRALWEGSTTAHDGNDSSADLALNNHLAYWTGKDAARMDRLFRSSSLMRPKWDAPARHGETYGQGTIRTAIADCRTTYNPSAERRAAVKEAERITAGAGDCCGGCACGCCQRSARLRAENEGLRRDFTDMAAFRRSTALSGKQKAVAEVIAFEVASARSRGQEEARIYYGDRAARKEGRDPGGIAGKAGVSPSTVSEFVTEIRERPGTPWRFRTEREGQAGPQYVVVAFGKEGRVGSDLAALAAIPREKPAHGGARTCPNGCTADLAIRHTVTCTGCGEIVRQTTQTMPHDQPDSSGSNLLLESARRRGTRRGYTPVQQLATRGTGALPLQHDATRAPEPSSGSDTDVGFDPVELDRLRKRVETPIIVRETLAIGGPLGFPPLPVNGTILRGRQEWERLAEPSMLPHLPAAYRAAEYLANQRAQAAGGIS